MKKFDKINELSDVNEALTILMEECAEVSQAAAKVIRFGKGEMADIVRLSEEIGDLLVLIEVSERLGLIDESVIKTAMEKKRKKLEFYSNLENFL